LFFAFAIDQAESLVGFIAYQANQYAAIIEQ
jgi:hypothetical protein